MEKNVGDFEKLEESVWDIRTLKIGEYSRFNKEANGDFQKYNINELHIDCEHNFRKVH